MADNRNKDSQRYAAWMFTVGDTIMDKIPADKKDETRNAIVEYDWKPVYESGKTVDQAVALFMGSSISDNNSKNKNKKESAMTQNTKAAKTVKATDEGYQGWKNHATWAVALHLDNDQGGQDLILNDYIPEIREESKSAENVTDDIWTADEYVKFTLADRLRSDVEDAAEEVSNPMLKDVLDGALSDVDWAEIAKSFIERAGEVTKTSTKKVVSRKYKGQELYDMPTISQGHTDNLKIQTPDTKVWLSRMTKEDGMPYDNQVTVEKLVDGNWVIDEQYAGGKIDKGE